MQDPSRPPGWVAPQPATAYPHPQAGYPQPQSGYPQTESGYPQTQSGYPHPQQGIPQPESGYPHPQQQSYQQYPGYQVGYAQPQVQVEPLISAHQDAQQQNYELGDDNDVPGFDFSDQSIRKSFIRKVYSILVVQLGATIGVMALFMFHEPTNRFVRNNPAMLWVAIGVIIVTMIALACCTEVRRKTPMNYIFLSIFTLAMGYMLGVTAASVDAAEVLLAVGITAAVVVALTIFAFQTKWDFTTMGGMLVAASVVLLLFGILTIFWSGGILRLLYSCAAVILFSFYIVYDTQMMMGGKHKYSISPEEYIFAALNLYLDIINLFIHILNIIVLTR